MLHHPIARPWNYASGAHSCQTCEGHGRIRSHERPSTWNPYPETTCNDCGGREGVQPCEVCGNELEVAGYDCIVCQMVDELPRPALADGDALTKALTAAITARLLSLSDRRAA